MKKETKTKFLKVRCKKCKNEQVIFNKTSRSISCLVCNELLAKPTGGKANILVDVLEVIK